MPERPPDPRPPTEKQAPMQDPTPAQAPTVFDVCVGLGYHCESTYQIRRVTGDERAHFFDWLDLDFESVLALLDTDFRDVLLPGSCEPFSDGLCAHDRGTGIRFFHEFRPAPGAPLSQDDIERQLPGVRDKFTYLAERWRELERSPARVLYVQHDAFDELTATDLVRLRELLDRRRPRQRSAVLWLRRTPPRTVTGLPPGVAWATVPEVPGRWEGSDEAWDRAFAALDPHTLWPHPAPSPHPAPATAPGGTPHE